MADAQRPLWQCQKCGKTIAWSQGDGPSYCADHLADAQPTETLIDHLDRLHAEISSHRPRLERPNEILVTFADGWPRISAALRLHKPERHDEGIIECAECWDVWPCGTIRALDTPKENADVH